MTNEHVVGEVEATIGRMALGGRPLKIEEIHTSRSLLGIEDDLAIIRCRKPHGLPPVQIAQDPPKIGDALYFVNQYGACQHGILHFVGSRGSAFRALVEAGMVNMDDPSYHFRSKIEGLFKIAGSDIYYSGHKLHEGDSGSPVFNTQGEVTAVICAFGHLTRQSHSVSLPGMKALIEAAYAL